MGLLIDSNVWIEAERGRFSLPEFLAAHRDEGVSIASITASELLHGVHRAKGPLARERRAAFVNGILDNVPVISFDLNVARLHAALWAAVVQKGASLGAHDLIIAATALSLGYAVVTFNDREFRSVPDLSVVNPSKK